MSQPWFRPELSRKTAEEFLSGQPIGAFVLRSGRDGSTVLSVISRPGHVGHAKILTDEDGKLHVQDNEKKFSTLAAMLESYSNYGLKGVRLRLDLWSGMDADDVTSEKVEGFGFEPDMPPPYDDGAETSTTFVPQQEDEEDEEDTVMEMIDMPARADTPPATPVTIPGKQYSACKAKSEVVTLPHSPTSL